VASGATRRVSLVCPRVPMDLVIDQRKRKDPPSETEDGAPVDGQDVVPSPERLMGGL
jgi:hypothetical protein